MNLDLHAAIHARGDDHIMPGEVHDFPGQHVTRAQFFRATRRQKNIAGSNPDTQAGATVGAHERSIREYSLSGRGITVGDPLDEFHGILTGTPRFTGPRGSLSDGGDE